MSSVVTPVVGSPMSLARQQIDESEATRQTQLRESQEAERLRQTREQDEEKQRRIRQMEPVASAAAALKSLMQSPDDGAEAKELVQSLLQPLPHFINSEGFASDCIILASREVVHRYCARYESDGESCMDYAERYQGTWHLIGLRRKRSRNYTLCVAGEQVGGHALYWPDGSASGPLFYASSNILGNERALILHYLLEWVGRTLGDPVGMAKHLIKTSASK